MFGRKSKELKPSVCVGCGCLIAAGRENRVKFIADPDSYSCGTGEYLICLSAENIYCGKYKPPYDKINASKYYRRVPEHFVEVAEDGEEVKPKKRAS